MLKRPCGPSAPTPNPASPHVFEARSRGLVKTRVKETATATLPAAAHAAPPVHSAQVGSTRVPEGVGPRRVAVPGEIELWQVRWHRLAPGETLVQWSTFWVTRARASRSCLRASASK